MMSARLSARQQEQLDKVRKEAAQPPQSVRSDHSSAVDTARRGRLTHAQYLETRPMPETVTKTLKQIDFFMREHGLKTMDFFTRRDFNTSYTSDGGDNTLSAEELYVIAKKCGMDVTAKEVRRVVNYLDGNGNQELDHEELNTALRRARREDAPRDRMTKIAELMITDPATANKAMMLSTKNVGRFADRLK